MTRDRLWRMQHRLAPYLFLSPFVALFCLFLLYPLARSLVLSLHKTVGPQHEVFVGLANYRFLMLDRLFWWSVLNTLMFTAAYLCLQVPLSLGLALLLNSTRLRARGFFRFAFFSTYLVGPVFVAVLFALILAPRGGLLNRLLGLFAGGPAEIPWLQSPYLALPAMLIASLWLTVGVGMIYFLAALQAVDRQLYEAAEVDGAGAWSRFWHVTLPGIRHVSVFLVLIGTIGALQLFELPYVMFGGPGPGYGGLTIVMYLFLVGFQAGDLGYAAAVGWMLVLLIVAVAYLQLRVTRFAEEPAP